MAISRIVKEIEKEPEKFSGRFEKDFVFFSFLLFLMRTVIFSVSDFEKNYGANPLSDRSVFPSIFYDSLGIAVAMMLTLLLATNKGYEVAKQLIQKDRGTFISIVIPLIAYIYMMIGILLGFPQFLQYMGLFSGLPFFFMPYWANGLIVSIFLFFGLKTTIVFALLREERIGLFKLLVKKDEHVSEFKIYFILLLISSPIMLLLFDAGWYALLTPVPLLILFSLAKAPFVNRNTEGLSFGDFLTAALPAGFLIALQSGFPLIWTLTVPVAGATLMITTNLGREHIHYSFVPRTGEEVVKIFYMMLLALVIFIPMALAVGFIEATTFLESDVRVSTLVGYIGTWVYIVGISEEFIFRCGLLILIKDGLIFWNKKKNFAGFMGKISSAPYFSAMIIAAFVFGVAHISKGVDYAFLAFLAGILYGYPFVKKKNLFGPIMLHAFVDVIAVAYFAAPL